MAESRSFCTAARLSFINRQRQTSKHFKSKRGLLFSASSLLDVARQFKNDLCKCNFTVCHPTPAN